MKITTAEGLTIIGSILFCEFLVIYMLIIGSMPVAISIALVESAWLFGWQAGVIMAEHKHGNRD